MPINVKRETSLQEFAVRDVAAQFDAVASEISAGVRTADLHHRLRQVAVALTSAHETLEAIVRASPAAILLLDLDGTVRLWNPAAERIYGWTAAETIHGFLPSIGVADRPRFLENLARIGRGEIVQGLEVHSLRRDGTVDVAIWAAPVNRADGTVQCLAIAADIGDRKRLDRMQTFLNDAGRLLAASLDYEKTFVHLANLAVPSYADWCFVDLIDESAESFDRVAVGHRVEAPVELAQALKRKYPLRPDIPYGISRAVVELAPQLLREINDDVLQTIAVDPAHRDTLRSLRVKSYVIAPLVARGRAIGTVTLGACSRNFDERDLWLTEELARTAALAIDNARLFSAEARARVRVTRMQEVTAALSRARTETEVAEVACRIGSEASHARDAAIWAVRDDGALVLIGSCGTPPEFLEHFRILLPGTGMPAFAVVEQDRPIWVETEEEYAAVSPTVYATAKRAGQINSYGAYPIHIGSKVVGVLVFGHPLGHRYDDDEKGFHLALAQHCSQAIERARLLDAERRLNERLRLLAKAGEVLSSSLDINETLAAVANVAVPSFADFCSIELVKQGALQRAVVAGDTPNSTSSKSVSQWITPLVANGREIGRVTFAVAESRRVYDEADRHFIAEFGRRAALAIVNADLYSQEHTARERLTRLNVLTSALAKAATPEDVARAATERGARALGCERALLFTLDSEIRLLHTHNVPPAHVEAVRVVSVDSPLPVAKAIRNRTPIWIESAEQLAAEHGDIAELATQLWDHRAFAMVPLIAGEKVLGALALGYAGAHRFSGEDCAFIMTVAHQCAQAFDRARLYRAAQEAASSADAANRIKDEFLATVSHELRTPLNAITGWSSLLAQKVQDPTAMVRGLEVIRRNAHAQAKIIEDILDVSRIVTGKLRIEPQPIDLAAIAREAIEVVRPSADAKRITLTFDPPEASPLVGDPERLQQVVWNLLSNAVKFTEDGGAVTIRIVQESSMVTLTVIDTGRGIQPEFLPYVFDRFQQADSSTTREFGGLGLGLAIVRHIVELHGGRVFAESKGLGTGASFVVKLPVRISPLPVASERKSLSPPPSSRSGRLSLSGVRILIVDDEMDTRHLVEAVLTEHHAEVRTADSARSALSQFETFAPDLIVSDLAMPGEDGYALIAKVRELPSERGGNTPMIALTAYARPEDRIRVLSAGFNNHVTKPVEPTELITVIANVVKLKSSRARASE